MYIIYKTTRVDTGSGLVGLQINRQFLYDGPLEREDTISPQNLITG